MNKSKLLAVFMTIIALTVVSIAAMKPATTEYAVFGVVPGSEVADIEGEGVVGTNVWTYSPEPIELYLTKNVVVDEWQEGSYWGFARILKKKGARLDFFFDCSGSELNTCNYRLMVLDGIYERETDTAMFDPGTMYLDYLGETVKQGTARFSIVFPEIGGGCISDAECDDGQFCNGIEECIGGTCQSGSDPCPGQGCDEGSDECVDCAGNKEQCTYNEDCCSGSCRNGTCRGN